MKMNDNAWKKLVGRIVARYAADPNALKKMSSDEVHVLYSEKMVDRREAMASLRLHPHDELAALRLAQAERDVEDIAGFLKGAAPKETVLDKLRREIESDTKAALSEPERLARTRAEKEQGPIEVPKKDKDRGMDR
jgi:hypothetical protein